MTELAVWLTVVGVCDLVRAARDATSPRRRALIAGLGVSLFGFAAVALDLAAGDAVLLLCTWTVPFLLWLLGSSAALGTGRVPARVEAFSGLGAGVLLAVLLGGRAAPVGDLPGGLAGLEPTLVLLVTGVGLAQLSTANLAVRLLLDAVGVPAATNEKKLKGGRLLGPMERLFIVGLALAGHVTAASVVVAAKGLLRFPELQRDAAAGPSDVTEYFLIGSFASWLLALAGAALVTLA